MSKISDAERAQIEEEAREILKKFSAALAKVTVKEQKMMRETESWREEGAGRQGDVKFRKAMLANASEHDEESVIVEKKKW